MNDLIKKIPRPVLVATILVIGITIAIIENPPGSICDVEISKMKKGLIGVIYSAKTKYGTKSAQFARTMPACRQGNSLGACFEFFASLRKILESISGISDSCQLQAYAMEDIQNKLKSGLLLLVQLAWGEAPPDNGPTKVGWLEISELSLFCGVKKGLQTSIDDTSWQSLQAGILSQLPGAMALSDDERLARSLFSINCESIK